MQNAAFVHKVFHHSNEVPTVFHYFMTNDELCDYNMRQKDNIHGLCNQDCPWTEHN
jgi:hypothetical protein